MSPLRRVIVSIFCALAALALLSVTTRGVSPSDPVPYETLPPDVNIETVVPGVDQLVAMDFTPDGRLLYTERTGNLQVVAPEQSPVTAYIFPVLTQGERGLLGVAVDPNFTANHYVWVYFTRETTYSYDCGGTIKNRVVRIVLNDDNSVTADPESAGCFPINQPAPGYYVTIHNGGNLHFGPDGKLYITVGNSDEVANDSVDPAQNLSSPLGKLHRFNPTVPLSAPPDNPFFNTPGAVKSIYARGLRNAFDFTFDPIGGAIFATENGDECDDEINLIRAGYNYGWRPYYPQTPLPCDDDVGPDPAYNTIPPLIHWTPSLAPTGIAVYNGSAIPEWQGDVFMCAFKDAATAIHHFKLNASRTAIVSHTILTDTLTHQQIKCRTDLLPGPDGALYFSEGGGYYAYFGPIKRLARKSSFASTSVTPKMLYSFAGSQLDYTIDLRHLGPLSSTFALTVDVPPLYAFLVGAQAANGVLNSQPFQLTWSGTLTGAQTWAATYRLQINSVPATSYLLTNSLRLTAPDVATVVLTPTVIVNGQLVFLPLIRREQ